MAARKSGIALVMTGPIAKQRNKYVPFTAQGGVRRGESRAVV